jgi:hypothetical protein
LYMLRQHKKMQRTYYKPKEWLCHSF